MTDGYGVAAKWSVTTSAVACVAASCVVAGAASPEPLYSSGMMLSTSNAGSAWHLDPVARGLDAVAAISCVGASCEAVANMPAGVYLGTSDAGAAWVLQAEAVTPLKIFSSVALRDVSCSSSTVCEGAGFIAVTTTQSEGVLARTTDGGKVWQIAAQSSAATLDAVACPSATVCVAAGASVGQSGGLILRTTNGGGKWTTEPLPGGAPVLTDVHCFSATRCEAVGASLAYSTVNGATWTKQTLPTLPQFSGLLAIACPTSLSCLAVGSSFSSGAVAVFTVNGGSSWKIEKLPAGVATLDEVTCPAANACEVAGNVASGNGALLFSTNVGGTAWTKQAVPPGVANVTGISCTSLNSCFAAGTTTSDTGVLLKGG